LEEWAHEQIFLTRHGVTPIFVLAPEGRAHDRALEQLRGAREIGATVIGVASSTDGAVAELADVVMPIVGGIAEEYSPLAYIVPGMLFATAMHQLRGRPPFTGGYTEEQLEVNSRQIFRSRVQDD
jgi:glucosamine 6-phosphate synthetase-like amidotransferase/phosphosugar isomerase protein